MAAAVGRIPAAQGETLALQVVEDADQHARVRLEPLGECPLADGAVLEAHQRHRVPRGESGRAAGLVAGLWVTPLGVAAAVGVTLCFIGAVISHLRVKDFELAPAATLALVAAAALALRVAA
ncbi:DoxX family protein [Streptomyces sp. KS 21]|uniref:DoxX family protein n=1 Tax=Streptomyces sp. KS 21 TaxID=2485150 RepID=UPI0010F1721B|nr:DoxX family protein [Streptomyces sp. KS 21]TDU78313.1 DoxX-like protein [Streptomyces sp. KS 21]